MYSVITLMIIYCRHFLTDRLKKRVILLWLFLYNCIQREIVECRWRCSNVVVQKKHDIVAFSMQSDNRFRPSGFPCKFKNTSIWASGVVRKTVENLLAKETPFASVATMATATVEREGEQGKNETIQQYGLLRSYNQL